MNGADTDTALDAALELHQQGRLAEAEALYQAVLAAWPNEFNALHLSGVLALQTGRAALAAERIEAALAIEPNAAIARSNLGNALRSLGRLNQALAQYDLAVALDPDNAATRVNQGAMLRLLGRFEEAVKAYDVAIAPRSRERRRLQQSRRRPAGFAAAAKRLSPISTAPWRSARSSPRCGAIAATPCMTLGASKRRWPTTTTPSP